MHLHLPVLVLLEEGKDNKFIERWFENSRFQAVQVGDVFQAVEEISDFTVKTSPEVLLLVVTSFSQDFYSVNEMVHASVGKAELPVFALSEKHTKSDDPVRMNLGELEIALNKLIPQRGIEHRPAA